MSPSATRGRWWERLQSSFPKASPRLHVDIGPAMACSRDRIPRLDVLTVMNPQSKVANGNENDAFLLQVAFVRINRVVIVGGVPHFVVNTFLEQPLSHIPTRLQSKRHTYISLAKIRDEIATRRSSYDQDVRQPDLIASYPFSAFEDLRRHISLRADSENRGRCFPCLEWMTFMTLTMSTESLVMKLLPSKSLRQHRLEVFINSAVLLATQTTVRPVLRQKCDIFDSISQLVSDFLRGIPPSE